MRQTHYVANTFTRTNQLQLILLRLWRVTSSVTPFSVILVTMPLGKEKALAETFLVLWKISADTSFLEGGSAMLLFEGTRASQVKE